MVDSGPPPATRTPRKAVAPEPAASIVDDLPRAKSKAARDAAVVLQNYNIILASTAMGIGLTYTGIAILSEQDEFVRRAGLALDGNDKLCRMLSGTGTTGSTVGLIVAYATMFGGILSTVEAREEISQVKGKVADARQSRKDARDAS